MLEYDSTYDRLRFHPPFHFKQSTPEFICDWTKRTNAVFSSAQTNRTNQSDSAGFRSASLKINEWSEFKISRMKFEKVEFFSADVTLKWICLPYRTTFKPHGCLMNMQISSYWATYLQIQDWGLKFQHRGISFEVSTCKWHHAAIVMRHIYCSTKKRLKSQQ